MEENYNTRYEKTVVERHRAEHQYVRDIFDIRTDRSESGIRRYTHISMASRGYHARCRLFVRLSTPPVDRSWVTRF